MKFEKPTPIQAATIPIALLGRDMCACAVTGSGEWYLTYIHEYRLQIQTCKQYNLVGSVKFKLVNNTIWLALRHFANTKIKLHFIGALVI